MKFRYVLCGRGLITLWERLVGVSKDLNVAFRVGVRVMNNTRVFLDGAERDNFILQLSGPETVFVEIETREPNYRLSGYDVRKGHATTRSELTIAVADSQDLTQPTSFELRPGQIYKLDFGFELTAMNEREMRRHRLLRVLTQYNVQVYWKPTVLQDSFQPEGVRFKTNGQYGRDGSAMVVENATYVIRQYSDGPVTVLISDYVDPTVLLHELNDEGWLTV